MTTLYNLNDLENKLGITNKSNVHIKSLTDPVQTHAIYGVTKETKKYWLNELKNAGAVKIREVKSGNFVILCFNAKNMI